MRDCGQLSKVAWGTASSLCGMHVRYVCLLSCNVASHLGYTSNSAPVVD
jgi:hypothetical protein